MQFDIRSNVRDVSRWLSDAEKKQVPFATVYAMTLTARDVKPAEQSVMQKVFSSPTPYALNALQVIPATKTSLVASVEFKGFGGTPAKRFLNPQVHGGLRSSKSHERRLSSILHGSGYFMPARDAPRDAYGNITGATFRRILSQLKSPDVAFAEATNSRRSKKARKSSAFFIPKRGGMVLERKGVNVKPVLIATRAPRYSKRFPFYETAARVVAERFDINFKIAFESAMAHSGYKTERGGKWRTF